jgi:hypothetical protein
MVPDAGEIETWLRGAFPVAGGNAELVYVSSTVHAEDLRVTLQLFVREDGRIRDIKEQDVDLFRMADADPKERVEALLQAWAAVLTDVLRDASEAGSDGSCVIDSLMPFDLAPDKNVLRLARSSTREDFENALRTKGRLGRFLET